MKRRVSGLSNCLHVIAENLGCSHCVLCRELQEHSCHEPSPSSCRLSHEAASFESSLLLTLLLYLETTANPPMQNSLVHPVGLRCDHYFVWHWSLSGVSTCVLHLFRKSLSFNTHHHPQKTIQTKDKGQSDCIILAKHSKTLSQD